MKVLVMLIFLLLNLTGCVVNVGCDNFEQTVDDRDITTTKTSGIPAS